MRAHQNSLDGPSNEAAETTQMLGSTVLLLMGARLSYWPTSCPASTVRSTWQGVRSARLPTQATPIFLLMACSDDVAAGTSETGEKTSWHGSALAAVVRGTAATDVPPQGMLINMMSVAEANEDELNAWYDTEHVPRIAAVPGVLAARRYRATEGQPHYAAIYLLAEAALPKTAAWQAAATTPWTQRIQRIRTDSARYLFDRCIDRDAT